MPGKVVKILFIVVEPRNQRAPAGVAWVSNKLTNIYYIICAHPALVFVSEILNSLPKFTISFFLLSCKHYKKLKMDQKTLITTQTKPNRLRHTQKLFVIGSEFLMENSQIQVKSTEWRPTQTGMLFTFVVILMHNFSLFNATADITFLSRCY